jgi:hypothetical protein
MLGNAPIIVQGRVVKTPMHPSAADRNSYGSSSAAPSPRPVIPDYSTNSSPVENYFDAGSQQSPACRDSFFALLFFAMIGGFVACSILYLPELNWTKPDDAETPSFNTSYLTIAGVQVLFASALSILSLSFMISCAQSLIAGCLIASVITNFLFAFVSLATGNVLGFVAFLLFGILMTCYASAVWSRIPFVSANLVTSINAVKDNLGVLLYAAVSLLVAIGWTFWWIVTALAISQHLSSLQNEDNGDEDNGDESANPTQMNGGILFSLLVAFYWVHQIVSGVVHTTVAGVVGTWWFAPTQASHCCSPAVTQSFFRSITYSFGSICFGSLIVAIIQALRALVSQARQSDDGLLACIADCILSCIESIAEYFNRWAFVYVGLYGYSFMEAGRNVITLFKHRGITALVTDDLVGNVLMFISFMIGCCVGGLGLILMAIDSDWFPAATEGDHHGLMVFFIGLLIGFMMSSILLSVVSSAVDTVIVCFAEAPADFHNNHRVLSDMMNAAWVRAFPSWRFGTAARV